MKVLTVAAGLLLSISLEKLASAPRLLHVCSTLFLLQLTATLAPAGACLQLVWSLRAVRSVQESDQQSRPIVLLRKDYLHLLQEELEPVRTEETTELPGLDQELPYRWLTFQHLHHLTLPLRPPAGVQAELSVCLSVCPITFNVCCKMSNSSSDLWKFSFPPVGGSRGPSIEQ